MEGGPPKLRSATILLLLVLTDATVKCQLGLCHAKKSWRVHLRITKTWSDKQHLIKDIFLGYYTSKHKKTSAKISLYTSEQVIIVYIFGDQFLYQICKKMHDVAYRLFTAVYCERGRQIYTTLQVMHSGRSQNAERPECQKYF